MSDSIEATELGQIGTILEAAHKYKETVQADPRYVNEHKAELIQANYAAARQDAQALAKSLLAGADNALQQAQAAHDQEFAAFYKQWRQDAAGTRVIAQSEAEALTTAGPLRVEVALNDAIRGGDYGFLKAFLDITAPALRQRAGKAGDDFNRPSMVTTLEDTARAAMNKLEPPTLQQARQRLQQAQGESQRMRDSVRRINARYATRTGGVGPLHVDEPTVRAERIDTANGKVHVTYSGGNWF